MDLWAGSADAWGWETHRRAMRLALREWARELSAPPAPDLTMCLFHQWVLTFILCDETVLEL